MPKRNIEINDTLEETIELTIDEVKAELERYLDENKPDELPCLNNDLDYSGAIHEIIDSSVPIYTKELEDTWYLYGDELKEALDDSGCYAADDLAKLTNDQMIMSAYYFYLQNKVNEWYSENAQEVFDQWFEKQPKEQNKAASL